MVFYHMHRAVILCHARRVMSCTTSHFSQHLFYRLLVSAVRAKVVWTSDGLAINMHF